MVLLTADSLTVDAKSGCWKDWRRKKNPNQITTLIWIDPCDRRSQKSECYIYILSSNFELCTRVTQLRSTYRSTINHNSIMLDKLHNFWWKHWHLKSLCFVFFHCRCYATYNTIWDINLKMTLTNTTQMELHVLFTFTCTVLLHIKRNLLVSYIQTSLYTYSNIFRI